MVYTYYLQTSHSPSPPSEDSDLSVHNTNDDNETVSEKLSHNSTIQTNHQIREEAFPLWASSHRLTFSNPLEFANKYLYYLSPSCITSLKSLNLTWQIKEKSPFFRNCASTIENGDISSQLRKLTQLLEAYPELAASFECLRTTLPSIYAHDHLTCRVLQSGECSEFCSLSVVLCEKITKLLSTTQSSYHGDFFIIEVASYRSWSITLWRVSKALYHQIRDQDALMKVECDICAARDWVFGGPVLSDHQEHDERFANVDEIAQAIENKKGKKLLFKGAPEYRPRRDRNWKVIFHPMGPRCQWNMALGYLEKRREETL